MPPPSPEICADLEAFLAREVVAPAVAPAVAAGFAYQSGREWAKVCSAAGQVGGSRPASCLTPFDLASATKPVVALCAVRLAQLGKLDLRQPLGELLPEADETPSAEACVELLLAHRAGLQAHIELFAPMRERRAVSRLAALVAAATARRPECTSRIPRGGFPPIYSDMGYLLVGACLEQACGAELDQVIHEYVTGPLELDLASAAQWHKRSGEFHAIVAPTEIVPFRGGTVRGIVHDENAWALSGHGVSGHAGLFGTVVSVLRFGALVLDCLAGRRTDYLAPALARVLVQPRPGGSLRAGFDGISESGSSAGRMASRESFGHLGFTGTSLWCDPDRNVVTAVLTNRVHPSRDHIAIRRARPKLHDQLWRLSERVGEGRPPWNAKP